MNATAEVDPRILKIQRDEIFVGYPTAKDIFDTADRLMGHENRERPEGLAIIGETHFGKSHILKRLQQRHPIVSDPNLEPAIPIARALVPPVADPNMLLRTMLSAVGGIARPKDPLDENLRRLKLRSERLGVRLFLLDEFHNALLGSALKQRELLATVRNVMSLLGRPFIIAGVGELKNVLELDPQLSNRFATIELSRWQNGVELIAFLKGMENALGLKNPSEFFREATRSKLLSLSSGQMGNMTLTLMRAAETAIYDRSEKITERLIEKSALGLPGSSR